MEDSSMTDADNQIEPDELYRRWRANLSGEQYRLRSLYILSIIDKHAPYTARMQTVNALDRVERDYLADGYDIVYQSIQSSNQDDTGGVGARREIGYQTLEIEPTAGIQKMTQHAIDHPEHGIDCACKDRTRTTICNWLQSRYPGEQFYTAAQSLRLLGASAIGWAKP